MFLYIGNYSIKKFNYCLLWTQRNECYGRGGTDKASLQPPPNEPKIICSSIIE
jgi:hypothetical protein